MFCIKFKEDGLRHKARIAVQKLIEIEILDFEETYSPVIEPTTIRVVLAIRQNKTIRHESFP